jgi:hypothetical protein
MNKCAQLLGFDWKVDHKTEAEAYARSWDILRFLDTNHGVKFKGTFDHLNVVADKLNNQEQYWFLSDNGGEINVQLINSDKMVISVPSSSCYDSVSAATIAYRIYFTMMGRYHEINWKLKVEEILDIT